METLGHIHRRGCSFLVAGRYDASNGFEELKDVPMDTLPDSIRSMFTALPSDEFRIDLSSTDIRVGNINRQSISIP